VQQRADLLAGAKPDRGTDQPLEEVKEPPEPELVDTEDSTLAGVAKRFKLNRKQRKAFFLIGETFERELECAGDPEKPRPPPLRIYIGGPGGTGKTQIVNAVRELFLLRGKADWLRTAAPTGTAAKGIALTSACSASTQSVAGVRNRPRLQSRRWSGSKWRERREQPHSIR